MSQDTAHLIVPDDESAINDVLQYRIIDNATENERQVKSGFRLYKRRFYILIVASMFGMLQGAIWNTWGPISDTASKVFGWDATTIALLPNWGTIMFIISFIPMVKLMLHFGLRVAIVHCMLLLVIGCGLRCLPCNNLWKTIFAHFCAIINGYCGTLAMIAPTAISATWFPPNERMTSTGIMELSNANLGTALSFFFAKFLVRDFNVTNTTGNPNNISDHLTLMRQDLDHYMYTEFGLSLFICLLVVLYFPKKPPSPPSSSAALGRVDFKRGAAQVSRQLNFWMPMLSYSLSSGAMMAFLSMLPNAVAPYGIDQAESDWIGFYMALIGIPGGFVFSRIADNWKRHTKLILLIGTSGAAASSTWFMLMCFKIVPTSTVCIYTSLLLCSFLANGIIPLFYEFTCEMSYPASEEVVTGFMAASSNLCCGLFLVALMVKSLGTAWVNPAVLASLLACVPMLLVMKADYRRHRVDIRSSSDES